MTNLKRGIFPDVCMDIAGTNQQDSRSAFYYPILEKCLENTQLNKHVTDVLVSIGVTRVGLYAVNEFMDYVLRDENITNLSNVKIYDLHYEKYQEPHYGKKVLSADQAISDYQNFEIEKIVICNLIFAEEIFNFFVSKGIKKEDVLTIDALIYGV